MVLNPQIHHLHIDVINCLGAANRTRDATAFINEGYMRLKPLLYPCTIEFSLMCLTVGHKSASEPRSPFSLVCLAVLPHLGERR